MPFLAVSCGCYGLFWVEVVKIYAGMELLMRYVLDCLIVNSSCVLVDTYYAWTIVVPRLCGCLDLARYLQWELVPEAGSSKLDPVKHLKRQQSPPINHIIPSDS